MLLAAAGAGLLGSMGLGGGGILMLYLGAVGTAQRLSQGINLVFILPVGLVGLLFHRKNNLVDTTLLLPILAGGAVGAAIGFAIAANLPEELLRRLFGLLLLALGTREIVTAAKMKKQTE